MANEEQLGLLRQGPAVWNSWRQNRADLSGADLSGADLCRADLSGADLRRASLRLADLRSAYLSGADLSGANLSRANLSGAILGQANLSGANLSRANLSGAILSQADFSRADLGQADLGQANLSGAILGRANLSGANLHEVNLSRANLNGANLGQANLDGAVLNEANLTRTNLDGANLNKVRLFETVFTDVDLSDCKGLESCVHDGPSTIDFRTLQRSGSLPLAFLRGVGLPDNLIDYLPSLLGQAIQFYSCFISYSSKDHAFAERLHADLQAKGVRCWFAPEDLKIGDRLLETIDMAIRVRDKLLLILSETSVASAWVLKEVRVALSEEDQHGRMVLFPVRLDDVVMDTTEQWAHDLRRNRHIGDFTRWKDHDAYSKGLERLLRDLKIER